MNRNAWKAMSRCRRRDHGSGKAYQNQRPAQPDSVIISVFIILACAAACGVFK